MTDDKNISSNQIKSTIDNESISTQIRRGNVSKNKIYIIQDKHTFTWDTYKSWLEAYGKSKFPDKEYLIKVQTPLDINSSESSVALYFTKDEKSISDAIFERYSFEDLKNKILSKSKYSIKVKRGNKKYEVINYLLNSKKGKKRDLEELVEETSSISFEDRIGRLRTIKDSFLKKEILKLYYSENKSRFELVGAKIIF